MHSVLRSSRAQTVLLFLFGLSLGFAILSSLAHGAVDAGPRAMSMVASAPESTGAPARTEDPAPARVATSWQPIANNSAAPAASPALTVPPDPVEDPGGAVDSVRSAWRDGRWLGVTLVAIYLLVLVARRYLPWLAERRRAVLVAAVLTALVTGISTLTAGGSPTLTWAINALVAGVLLYLRPEPVPAEPES